MPQRIIQGKNNDLTKHQIWEALVKCSADPHEAVISLMGSDGPRVISGFTRASIELSCSKRFRFKQSKEKAFNNRARMSCSGGIEGLTLGSI